MTKETFKVSCMALCCAFATTLFAEFESGCPDRTPFTGAANLQRPKPVRPTAFRALPLGEVRAERWLEHQLVLQREGLTGHAEELYDDIGQSNWLTRGHKGDYQYSWERGPYYAKGLLALAYALGDDGLKKKAQRWVESILASQRPNGDFGPLERSWWPNMVALHLMRDYFEATGDERVIPFFERYFSFQRKALKEKALYDDSPWADCRGGDELEVILWFAARPGKENWLDFARFFAKQVRSRPAYGEFTRGTAHIVDFMMTLKTPALKWRLGGAGGPADAYWGAFGPDAPEFVAHGRPDRMLNGTEMLSGRRASEGAELCATVERILSNKTLIEISGDARIADDLETVAYNSLPATVSPDLKGTRYYNILNQVICDDRHGRDMKNNGEGEATCPGPEAGFGCCRSNWHFGWPKFVSSLWMAAGDGLAAVAYGPCRVKTRVADGEVAIREETDYPFREKIAFSVTASTAKKPFEIRFRIPGWCTNATLAVNGAPVVNLSAGSFAPVRRVWSAGDLVELVLPMKTIVSREGWSHESAAVLRGPLVFAHPIAYRREEIKKGGAPEKGFPKYRLLPTEPWNEALVVRDGSTSIKGPAQSEQTLWKVIERPVADQPFDPATPAVVIEAEGMTTTAGGWGQRMSEPGNTASAVEPPWLWKAADETHPLLLQPVGATELRITLFPFAAGGVK